jgi:hypothetical protein
MKAAITPLILVSGKTNALTVNYLLDNYSNYQYDRISSQVM